jgi:uncharacterized membrane protein YgdD (TMEM256/DUF423 family)
MHEHTPERRWLLAAGAFGFVAVALGAFGAHGLEGWLATLADGERRLSWWRTGVDYHFWHTLLLLGAAAASPSLSRRSFVALAWLVVAGLVLFSGSLYIMTLTGLTALGAITPLGGLCFLGAWLCLLLGACKGR